MSVYFPPELLEQVRQSAEDNHRSFNQEVLSILDRFLNRAKNSQKKYDLEMQLLKEIGERMVAINPEIPERLAKDETYQAWLQACKDEMD